MRRLKTLGVMVLLAFSLVTFFHIPKGEAAVGKADVYIMCLPDVGGWWVDDPHRVKEGVITALTPVTDSCDSSNIPLIHTKFGKTPPFLGISYEVVTDWNAYKEIVELGKGKIIVNTHGEILPVPSGYSKEAWTDKIAEAMLDRRIIWVHIAGYPFYYVWYEGASDKETWENAGFQRLMQHINKGDVLLPYLPGDEKAGLTTEMEKWLGSPWGGTAKTGWQQIYEANEVLQNRPLLRSDFEDYIILPIWHNEGSEYYEGAVVAFVKPNEEFYPLTRSGFGAYVHIGTSQTYDTADNPTDADFYRGYVGCAAAVWTATTGFRGVAMSSRYDPGDVNFTIHAAPTITDFSWWVDEDCWEIHIGFFILGGLKRPYYSSIDIDKIGLYVKPEIPDFEGNYSIEPYDPLSRNAYPYHDVVNTDNGLVLKSALYGLSFFDPTHITKVLSGVMLFSDWLSAITYTDNSPNNEEINIEFLVDTYTTSGDYDIIQFQSMFAVNLKIYKSTNSSDREGWRTIPIHWGVQLTPTGDALSSGPITGDTIELAVHFPHGDEYTGTVFSDDFEDFELAAGEYSAGDIDEGSGSDTWGTRDYKYAFEGTLSFPAGKCLWCAARGRNSIYGEEPNIEVLQYDKEMEAYLVKYIDLKPYKQAQLFYLVGVYFIEPGDYLELYVLHINYTLTLVDSITSSTNREWRTIELQNTVKSIKFVFHSDDDNIVDIGAMIYYIEIRATIPNDAETNQDAGNNINTATSTDKQEFTGYLDDEDWYTLSISPAANENTSFQVTPPENAIFNLELYNPADEKIAGPSTLIQLELPAGTYKIRIYSVIGFGPYRFKMKYIDTGGGDGGGGGGGGACPTLFSWNGTGYVEETLLDIHANSDVTVDYRLKYLDPAGRLCMLSLRELDNHTSHVDYVKLYAVDAKGNWHECRLILAWHTQLGPVTKELRYDDDTRVDLTPGEKTRLFFLLPEDIENIQYFTFKLNGYNPKGPVMR